MKQTDIVLAFLPLLLAELQKVHGDNVDVIQAYQSTEQDIPSGPTVFFHRSSTALIGSMQRKNKIVNGKLYRYEYQIEQHDYIFTARYRVNPQLPPDEQYTPSDIITFVRNQFMRKGLIDDLRNLKIKVAPSRCHHSG